MVERGKKLLVALCNPRLMREFRSLAQLLDLDFSIPAFRESVKSREEIVLADEECVRSFPFKKSASLIVNESNLARVVFSLSGRSADVLVVGVDPGKRFAYVIIGGGVIFSMGYVDSFKELLGDIEALASKLKSRRVIVKVGEQGRDKVLELMQSFLSKSFEFYIVSEDKTNLRNPYLMRGKYTKFNKDINAALNIALKNGLRINAFWPTGLN